MEVDGKLKLLRVIGQGSCNSRLICPQSVVVMDNYCSQRWTWPSSKEVLPIPYIAIHNWLSQQQQWSVWLS